MFQRAVKITLSILKQSSHVFNQYQHIFQKHHFILYPSANDLNRNIKTLIELASGLTFIIYLPVKEFVLLQHKTFLSALIFLKSRHLIHFFI